jgi:hypothetical protein
LRITTFNKIREQEMARRSRRLTQIESQAHQNLR